jgi:hypothetical protein
MARHLTRCIHERFYGIRRSAGMTGVRSAGLPLEPSTYGWGLAFFFLAPVPSCKRSPLASARWFCDTNQRFRNEPS